MVLALHPTASRRRVALFDVVVVAWLAAWVVTGLLVMREVNQLDEITVTLEESSEALAETAEGLRNLERLPFVGDRIGRVATEVEETAAAATASAAQSRDSIADTALLLGVVVMVLPSVPVVGLYVPARAGRWRERRAVAEALRGGDEQAAVKGLLAARALANLPFHRLLEITDRPWQDLADGRFDRLAAAERARLGLG